MPTRLPKDVRFDKQHSIFPSPNLQESTSILFSTLHCRHTTSTNNNNNAAVKTAKRGARSANTLVDAEALAVAMGSVSTYLERKVFFFFFFYSILERRIWSER